MTKKQAKAAAAKFRLKLLAEKKRKEQDEKEERLLARWLLFCKGSGKDKNLNQKDSLFVNRVVHKAYDRYMSDLTLGTKNRLNFREKLRMTRWTPSRPPSFHSYRRVWYGSAKHNYVKSDVPKLMNMRMEALRNGSTNTEMQERGGRYMQELRRAISERERGNLDIPMRDLQVHPGSVEGLDKGQKQLRERRKKTPAGNRNAAAVGA